MKFDKKSPRILALHFYAQEMRGRQIVNNVIETALPDLNKHKLLKINSYLCMDVFISSLVDGGDLPPGIYRRELVDSYILFDKDYLKKLPYVASTASDLEDYLNRRKNIWDEREATRNKISNNYPENTVNSAGKAIDKLMLPYTEEDIGFFVKKKTPYKAGQNQETYWVASDKLIRAFESIFVKKEETTDEK